MGTNFVRGHFFLSFTTTDSVYMYDRCPEVEGYGNEKRTGTFFFESDSYYRDD